MAEDPPSQQPAQAADKTQAPATFSSFINKSSSGKKFAPKAARRRPGAAPAPATATAPAPKTPAPAATQETAPAPKATAPAPAPAQDPAPAHEPAPTPASTAEPHTSQAAPASSNENAPAVEPAVEPILAPTAQPTVQPATETAVPPPVESTVEPTVEPTVTLAVAPTVAAPLPTPALTQEPATQEPATQNARHSTPPPTPASTQERQTTPPPVDLPPTTAAVAGPAAAPPVLRGAALLNYARSLSPRKATPAPPSPTKSRAQYVTQQPVFQPSEDEFPGGGSPKRRRIESPTRQSTPLMPVAVMMPPRHAQTSELLPTPSTEIEAPTQNGQSTQPWTAVNHSQGAGGEASRAVVEPPAKKKRAPPKPRAKKKTTAVAGEEGERQQDGEEAEPTQPRPNAKARGKRRADAAEVGEDGQPVKPPPKKPRKPRKDKGKQPAADGETEAGEPGQEGDATTQPKRKPRAPRRKKATPAEGEDGSAEPKRRGRPPRGDTPSDAEDHTIDPDAMCMDDLASRNIRVGKLSRREKEMRKIDWDAVKQRRREEDARHISTKESQAAVDKLLEMGEVESAPTGPRYHVVDGRIELIQDSGTIDRERDADREIELMTITEEDDLTTRITSRSFMKNNKRFPNEFVLPGQGKRWNAESNEMFYQGLRSFGTDFQMIAHMFPGMTRRSIKTKFTREERENPDIVRDCLRGASQLVSHWDHFLAASQLEEESFADADAIKRDLEEEEARMREQINEALREKEEREKQKKLAGVAEEGEGGADAAANAKGKKKRKGKDKSVAFVEEGVEILGDVDDDPNWGQE